METHTDKLLAIIINKIANNYNLDKQMIYDNEIIINHLQAMINRRKNGEKLPDIDKDIFTELSTTSLQHAQDIVYMLGNLQEDEKYLLAVHFYMLEQQL